MIQSMHRLAGPEMVHHMAVAPSLQHVKRGISIRKTRPFGFYNIGLASVKRWIPLCTCVVLFIISYAVMASYQVNYLDGAGHGANRTLRYVVQPGDTLWKIAMKEKMASNVYDKIEKIESLNRLDDNSNIYPGQVLWIPSGQN
jgi:nucleoid-associated protein YgaU